MTCFCSSCQNKTPFSSCTEHPKQQNDTWHAFESVDGFQWMHLVHIKGGLTGKSEMVRIISESTNIVTRHNDKEGTGCKTL